MTHSSKVVDRVYQQLKELVISFEIPPGHQIHIADVADKLNVSVTPVREALNRLLNEGYLARSSGRGFYNRHIDIEELRDLFQLRGSIAIGAIHILLRTNLRDQVETLLISPELSRNGESGSPFKLKICENIIAAVGNHEIMRIYRNISDRMKFIWDIYSESSVGAAQIEEYRHRLSEALLERDMVACVEVIERNIETQIWMLDEVVQVGLARAYGGGFTHMSRFSSHTGFRSPLHRSQTEGFLILEPSQT
ncbi:GntR family transcriptional regulator [Azospirillum baldaniorum]|uniref:GntR family transcriptional regulator n=1 Tax=Azospirillum baldaniorum TaxID=1064539 RepID=UPI00059FB130|nr:GntR family transcriptional regulator [Azospirillum baldaniorum]AWJ90317.1 GntR family transcriptional regulator [Azospirillum baldaniorum]TWA75180.1 GntR family transcriptional regulator [Azospirillum brasilense]